MFSNYDILIIEDEKVVIDSAKKILIPEGFKVDDTFSVDKALQKLKQNKYKLILTDLMLPKISGIELTEIVTQKYPDIPIIIITGYATLENAVQSLKVGAFDFIPKPFAFEELLGVVQRAMKFRETINLSRENRTGLNSTSQQTCNGDDWGKYYLLGHHSWAKLSQDGTAILGISATYSRTIGKTQQIYFPEINDLIIQGNMLVRIITPNQMLHRVWAPLSGKVIEKNKQFEKKGIFIDEDPFIESWLVYIIPANLEEELLNLTLP